MPEQLLKLLYWHTLVYRLRRQRTTELVRMHLFKIKPFPELPQASIPHR
jgi:hypothetical protein